MDASEIYSKRLNAKEVIFHKQNGKFMFPVADGRVKFIGGDLELRTSTLIRDDPIRGEGQRDFLGESEGSLSPPQDSLPDAGEAINDFWSMSGNFIYAITLNPESNFTRREKNLSLFMKYIDVSRTTHTNLDVMQESRIDDYWNIDGPRDLSDSWAGFIQFTLLNEKPPDGYMWSGGRLTRKQLTSRPDHLWPELWEKMGKNAKLKEKHKWSHEKLQLDNARRLRGIFSLTLRTRSSKKPLGMLEKMETPGAPAMPCKTCKNSQHVVTSGKSDEIKSKLACILEASESTRLRMGESLPNHHADHIEEKGHNSPQHYNLVHKFIPVPQAMKIPAAKAAVEKT